MQAVTPPVPADVKAMVISNLPWIIAIETALVVGTATMIQTLNTLVLGRYKAQIELLDKELERRDQELSECKDALNAERNRPAVSLAQATIPPVLNPRPRLVRRWIIGVGLAGLTLALISIPFSDTFKKTLSAYRYQSSESKKLAIEVDSVAKPFTIEQLLNVYKSQPEFSHNTTGVDGRVFDLDHSPNKKFIYSGSQPAVLVGKSTKGLLLTSANDNRFELLITPYQAQR